MKVDGSAGGCVSKGVGVLVGAKVAIGVTVGTQVIVGSGSDVGRGVTVGIIVAIGSTVTVTSTPVLSGVTDGSAQADKPMYLPLYNERQSMRHNVRPGLTGLAQVNGRNLLTWEEKFEWDVKYVENISLWLDIKILFKTVYNVLKREGISSETSATMESFKGSSEKQEAEETV